jgi:flagella basal body P-ring formation protein FlgA
MKRTFFILAVLVGVAMAQTPSPQVKIYLPRGLAVSSGALTLGEICIIRCDDENILHKASAVSMGRGPFFKESLALSRSTILARLGASGIDTSGVVFSGAPAVTLESKDQALAPDQLVLSAQEFLVQKKPLPEDRVWRLVGVPSSVAVSDLQDVQIKPRLAARQNPLPDQVRIEVAICRQDKELAVAEATFQADYLVQQAVAVKDIPAHAKLTEEDFKVRIVAVPNKPSAEWTSPLAMEATVAIEHDKVIGPGQVKMPKLEIIVHRDQKVKMMVEGLGFRINGIGQAMDNGRPGDIIRVLNMDSQQAVACRVAADGTVHPLYDEVKK